MQSPPFGDEPNRPAVRSSIISKRRVKVKKRRKIFFAVFLDKYIFVCYNQINGTVAGQFGPRRSIFMYLNKKLAAGATNLHQY